MIPIIKSEFWFIPASSLSLSLSLSLHSSHFLTNIFKSILNIYFNINVAGAHLPFQLHWSLEYWQIEIRQRSSSGSREANTGVSMFVSPLTLPPLRSNFASVRRRVSSYISFPCARGCIRAAPRVSRCYSRVLQTTNGAYSPPGWRSRCWLFSVKSGLNRASSVQRELCCSPRHSPCVGYYCGAFRRSAQARIFHLRSINTKVGFLLTFLFFDLHEIKCAIFLHIQRQSLKKVKRH